MKNNISLSPIVDWNGDAEDPQNHGGTNRSGLTGIGATNGGDVGLLVDKQVLS